MSRLGVASGNKLQRRGGALERGWEGREAPGTQVWGRGRNGRAPKGEPPKNHVLTSQEKCFQNERR